MRTTAAILLSLVLLAGGIVLTAAPAAACSCEEVAIEDAIGPHTAAAFVGEAVSVVDVGYQEGVDQSPLVWTISVETVLHGEVAEVVDVGSGYDDGDCGIDFGRLGRVGIVAYRYGTGLSSDICGGVWGADELIAAHGPGSVPVPIQAASEPVEPATSGPPLWFWIVSGGAVLLAGAGLVLAKRSRDDESQDGWRTPSDG